VIKSKSLASLPDGKLRCGGKIPHVCQKKEKKRSESPSDQLHNSETQKVQKGNRVFKIGNVKAYLRHCVLCFSCTHKLDMVRPSFASLN